MQQITDVKAKFRRVFLSHFFTEYAYKQSGIVVHSGAGKSVMLSRDAPYHVSCLFTRYLRMWVTSLRSLRTPASCNLRCTFCAMRYWRDD